MARRRHVPQRTCIACRTTRSKRELIRIVRTPEGEIVIDPTGKRAGRGAYLCPVQRCWQVVLNANGRQLGRALKVPIPAEVLPRLREFAAGLPATLPEEEQETSAPAPT